MQRLTGAEWLVVHRGQDSVTVRALLNATAGRKSTDQALADPRLLHFLEVRTSIEG
jgi:hypothetical protein